MLNKMYKAFKGSEDNILKSVASHLFFQTPSHFPDNGDTDVTVGFPEPTGQVLALSNALETWWNDHCLSFSLFHSGPDDEYESPEEYVGPIPGRLVIRWGATPTTD